jgi:hypothetical protein
MSAAALRVRADRRIQHLLAGRIVWPSLLQIIHYGCVEGMGVPGRLAMARGSLPALSFQERVYLSPAIPLSRQPGD